MQFVQYERIDLYPISARIIIPYRPCKLDFSYAYGVLKPRRSHKALLPVVRAARSRTRMTHDALMHSLSLRMGSVLRIHRHAHLHLHLHHGSHLIVKGVLVRHGEWVLLSWVRRRAVLLLLRLRSRTLGSGYGTWLNLYFLHGLQLLKHRSEIRDKWP